MLIVYQISYAMVEEHIQRYYSRQWHVIVLTMTTFNFPLKNSNYWLPKALATSYQNQPKFIQDNFTKKKNGFTPQGLIRSWPCQICNLKRVPFPSQEGFQLSCIYVHPQALPEYHLVKKFPFKTNYRYQECVCPQPFSDESLKFITCLFIDLFSDLNQ